MSVGKKLKSLTGDLGELDSILGSKRNPSGDEASAISPARSAPVRMLQFSAELLPYQEKIEKLEAMLANMGKTRIEVSRITPNPWQPRQEFKEDEMQELAASIKASGQIQPIAVRVLAGTSGQDIQYQLVVGERRWRAHQMIGAELIDAVILEVPDQKMFSLALAENISRSNLSHYEIFKAIRRGQNEFSGRAALAEDVGMSRSRLYQYLEYQKLPAFVIADLEKEPSLLGADAAGSLVKVLTQHGAAAEAALQGIWPEFKKGTFDQTKLAALTSQAVRTGVIPQHQPARDIRKFWDGKAHAATITKDGDKFSISIKASHLKPEHEAKLRELISEFYRPEAM